MQEGHPGLFAAPIILGLLFFFDMLNNFLNKKYAHSKNTDFNIMEMPIHAVYLTISPENDGR